MLVLSRKVNQSIMVGDNVRVVVVAVDRDQVKLGIEAPREIAVHRSEIYEEIQRSNRAAAGLAASPAQGPGQPAATVGRATLQPRKKPVKPGQKPLK
jgi:carbon storage regulator